MTLEELWKIKDKISDEIKGLSTEEIVAYFKKSGDAFDKLIAERKKALAENQDLPVNHTA